MKTCALTDIGSKRTMNQDYFFCSDTPVGILPNLYIVADGMGGHNAGDYASRFCVERFTQLVEQSKERTRIQTVESALKITNDELIAKAKSQKDLEGMGTTFVMATIQEDGYMLAANVGDSRLYLINDEVRQITQDHSLVAEMVRNGDIRKEEARFHPNKNVVLRALCTQVSAQPDFYKVRVKPGDYLLLCSDGLSDMLEESEMFKLVSEYDEVRDIAEKMVALANENGGKDNITLVLIKI